GLIKLLLALKHRTLPPTANFQTPSPRIELKNSPFRVLQKHEPWLQHRDGQPRRCAISGFGFGGINAHVLLEEFHGKSERKQVVVSQPSSREPIAIVGMDARFGPWRSLRKFRDRVLGFDAETRPGSNRRWWGAE